MALRPRLLVFLFLAIPLAANDQDELAGTLARRIAALVGGTNPVALTFTNLSGVDATDALRIRRSLEERLAGEGVRLAPKASDLRVTLSENLQSYLLVAQTNGGRVVISSIPRTVETSKVAARIRTETVFESPRPILDFALVDDTLLVLEPEGVSIFRRRGLKWEPDRTLSLPDSGRPSRDPRGTLHASHDSFEVSLPELRCNAAIIATVLGCEPQSQRENDAAVIETDCGPLTLDTGRGDYTVPDVLRAFRTIDAQDVPVSDSVDLPGPVMALHARTAVIRNLKTGLHEALRISVTCAR